MSAGLVEDGEEILTTNDFHESPEGPPVGFSPTGAARKSKRKNAGKELRKAPQAPKRFKSSYICFFMAKQTEIKEELGDKSNVTAISKRSAEMWKNLPPEERAHWDEVALKDKERYLQEKAMYTGPWQVPYKRQKKNPAAPKRPMSAFLFFSIGQRSKLKKENPEMKNTDISRILGEMWRNLPKEERDPHVEREKSERAKYKIAIAEWKQENEAKEEAQRAAHEQMVAAMGQNAPGNMYDMYAPQRGHPFTNNVPPPPPHLMMLPGYPYPPPFPPGAPPFNFPANGKAPVVLGPTGLPYSMPPVGVPPPYPPPQTVPFEDSNPTSDFDVKHDFGYASDGEVEPPDVVE